VVKGVGRLGESGEDLIVPVVLYGGRRRLLEVVESKNGVVLEVMTNPRGLKCMSEGVVKGAMGQGG